MRFSDCPIKGTDRDCLSDNPFFRTSKSKRSYLPMQSTDVHDNQHLNFQKIIMWYWK